MLGNHDYSFDLNPEGGDNIHGKVIRLSLTIVGFEGLHVLPPSPSRPIHGAGNVVDMGENALALLVRQEN